MRVLKKKSGKPVKRSTETKDLFLKKMVHCLPDATIIVDDESRCIVKCNGMAEDTFGYSAGELEGKEASLLFSDESDFAQFTRWLSALSKQQRVSHLHEFPMQRKDGTLFSGECSAGSLISDNEKLLLWACAIRAVSGRKGLDECFTEQGALRKSEGGFSKAFYCSPSAMAITRRKDGQFVDANEAFEQLTGYSRGELLGRGNSELGLLDNSHSGTGISEALNASGGVRNLECRLRTRMNTEVTVLVSAELNQIDGEPHIFLAIMDITAHKSAEKALAKSEARYRLLFNGVNDAIFVHAFLPGGVQGRFIEVNDVACQRLGYTRDELLRMSPADIGAPENRRLLPSIIERLQEEGVALWEGTHVSKTGMRIPIEVSNHLLDLDAEAMVLSVVRDITDRRKAEEALRESEEKYRSLVENSLAGVYIYQDNLFRFVNKRFCEIYGYTYEKIVDTLNSEDIMHPEDRHIFEELRKRFLAGELDDVRITYSAVRRDGNTIVLSVVGSLMIYNGRPAVSGAVYDITEHERAQEELRQKSALLEAQMNASLDGIIVVDKGRNILQNRRVIDLLKIPKEIAENDDDGVQIRWVKGLVKNPEKFDEKVSYMFAHREEAIWDELELKDGTVLDSYSGPVIGKDGKYYGRIWTFRDITERKRSEDVLRSSRIQLAEAMNLANIVYWEFDPSTLTYTFTDRFYEFLGTTVEREGGYRMAMNEYVERFIHPDDAPAFYRRSEENMTDTASERFADFEHRLIRRDGGTRYILTRKKVIRDAAGHIVRVYGSNQDITGRRQSEAAVRESEERFRKVFEDSPVGMTLAGADFRFQRVNEAICRMLGYTEQEMVKLTFKDVLHPRYMDEDSSEGELFHIRELFHGHISSYQAEKRYIRKDGTVAWGFSTMKVVRGKDGRFLYLLSMVEDITQRKQTEDELRKREEDLEIKSSHLEEANTALKVLLRHRDEDKGMLEATVISNVSELVMPYVDKLKSSHLNADQAAYLDILGTNLGNIVSPFLREITVGYTHLTPAEIRVADLIKNGKTSKEIAEVLKVSKRTVDTHRENIRNKLELGKKRLNLQSYLRSIS